MSIFFPYCRSLTKIYREEHRNGCLGDVSVMHKNPSGRLGACVCEDCETGVHLSCTTAASGGGKGHAGQGKGDYKG